MTSIEEQFDTFDDAGQPTGLKPRSEVHRLGYWHRSAQLFLYTATGELIVHQRVAHKDLYAGLWDHSIGEHLHPGESYQAGAVRGAAEELGLRALQLKPLGEVRRQAFKDPEGAYWDRELQQSFVATYDPSVNGPIQADPDEVAKVDRWSPVQLHRWLTHNATQLTPWFYADLAHHGLLPSMG